MPNQEVMLNIAELKDGAYAEKLAIELHKAIENIQDLNTDENKVRTVTLKINLRAIKGNRAMIDMSATASSKLIPAKDISTVIIADKDRHGSLFTAELKSGARHQTFIDEQGTHRDDTGKVINIK